jgi:hypothetical protein
MNERIRKIAKESGLSISQAYSAEFNKFAELLIEECVEVVKWTPSMFPNDEYVKNIKEHFGVE